MDKETEDKLIKQGIEILRPFLDVSKWTGRIEHWEDHKTAFDITFTNEQQKIIRITKIYLDEKTEEIWEYGSNYGELVF